ncbi:MAG: TlpA family protein disulfide reductase [Blastocatellia bacterium]|nr:TlpA family protein disulfide reductase [Blastocatellia bacterium]
MTSHLIRNRFTRFLASGLFSLGLGLTGVLAHTPAVEPVPPIQKQVDFSLQSPQGGTVTTAQVQGKITVMLFGAKGLPLMRESLQQLQRVSDRYPEINVYVVVTNSNQPKDANFVSDEDLRSMMETSRFHFSVLRDPNGDLLFKKLGLRVLPSLIVLNRKGELAAAAREGLDPNANLASQLSWEIEKSQ